LLTAPDSGALLDISEHRYRPAQRLRDYVCARDDVCAVPTCNQPGYRCEYEHITPYTHSGTTSRRNGALACRRHNQCKTNTGGRYRHNEDGSFTWTSSTGHAYTSPATTQWTSTTDQPKPPSPPATATPERKHAEGPGHDRPPF
jgi:HNH endonuclease